MSTPHSVTERALREAARRIVASAAPLLGAEPPPANASTANPASALVSGLTAHRMTANADPEYPFDPLEAAGAGRNNDAATKPLRPRAWRDSLAHGLYATVLASAGKLLGEDPAYYAAMCDALVARYDPQDLHEEFLVERLALLWWRVDRLRNVSLANLNAALTKGEDPVTAAVNAERTAAAEARLERAIARLHKELLWLARYRQKTRSEAVPRFTSHDRGEAASEGASVASLDHYRACIAARVEEAKAAQPAEQAPEEQATHAEEAVEPDMAAEVTRAGEETETRSEALQNSEETKPILGSPGFSPSTLG